MASLITCLAKALRRYDAESMLVLADLCEERELHESARILRLDDRGPRGALYEAYTELHRVRGSVRKPHPLLKVYKNNTRLQKRFKRWLGEGPNPGITPIGNATHSTNGYIQSRNQQPITPHAFRRNERGEYIMPGSEGDE